VDLYSTSTQTPLTCSQAAQIWITQCCLQTTPYLPLFPVAEHHRPLASTYRVYLWRDG